MTFKCYKIRFENNIRYIGVTSKPIYIRIQEHKNGRTATTKKIQKHNKLIDYDILETFDTEKEALQYEIYETLKEMKENL